MARVKASKEVMHLQSVVYDLERQLDKARDRLNKALKAEHPFQRGDVVLVTPGYGKKSFVARVQYLSVRYDEIEMEVGKRLKSGAFSTFGTRVSTYTSSVEPYTGETDG